MALAIRPKGKRIKSPANHANILDVIMAANKVSTLVTSSQSNQTLKSDTHQTKPI